MNHHPSRSTVPTPPPLRETREPQAPSRLRRSLRACTVDGTLYAVMLGFGETFFPAFALLLGASPLQVGVLATFPMLAGAIFQLVVPRASRWTGEKHWVVASAFLQALTFLPIAWLARSRPGSYPWLLFWVCAYWMIALGINPAWNAWMGRMIPRGARSRYFGRRSVPIQLSLFCSVMAAGMVIDTAQRWAFGPARGFVAIFLVAAVSRVASAWFLTRQHDPGKGQRRPPIPVRELLAGVATQPYGRLVWLLVLVTGSVHISAAYFTPFMLQGLQLSYAQFTVLTGAIVVARVLASPYWGEIARFYGNRRALQVSAVLLVPLSGLWVVSGNFAYLIGLQVFAGFAWAGFELTTVLNFFDCTDDRNRAQVLSLYNLLNGVAIVIGSLVGGTVLHYFPTAGYPYIFLGSSVCRAATVLFVARGVGARRRPREHSFGNVFFRVITLRPGQGGSLRPVVIDDDR